MIYTDMLYIYNEQLHVVMCMWNICFCVHECYTLKCILMLWMRMFKEGMHVDYLIKTIQSMVLVLSCICHYKCILKRLLYETTYIYQRKTELGK